MRRTFVIEIGPEPQRFSAALREVWNARPLLGYFLARDLKGRYRGTLLGNWWIMVRPLVELLPYMIVFGLFLRLGPDHVPYVIYLLSGFAPWLLFGNTLNAAPATLTRSRSLVSKVYFPRLIVPLSDLLVRSVDFGIVLAAVVVASIVFGLVPVAHIWALPVFVVLLLLLALGAALLVTTICTLQADLGHGVPAGTRLLFYLSPIVYPLSIIPDGLRPVYDLNPLTTVVSGIRWSLFGIDQPSAINVGVAGAVALAAVWLGLYVFLRIDRRLTDLL
ncbi:MAG TPA: ABC transporter permease [Hyphomicrobiaceae bacterium]|nr:ABC transporter permease [Hyphomicrobiaceae bacterium]